MAVAAFFASGTPYGLSHIEHFTERNMFFTNEIISSQRLSDLYLEVTPELREEFFKGWVSRCLKDDKICYDVTSISSYSDKIPLVD